MKDIKTPVVAAIAQLEEWRERYFPERQLFLRSQGRVRFLTIHSYTQVAISAIGVLALGWGLVTSYAYVTRDGLIEDKNETISTMSSQYENLSSEFSALEAEVERRTKLLEERHTFLEELVKEAPAAAPSLLPLVENNTENNTAVEVPVGAAGGPLEEAPEDNREEDKEVSFLDLFFNSKPSEPAVALSNTERRQALLARLEQLDQEQRATAQALMGAAQTRLADVDATIGESGVSLASFEKVVASASAGLGGPFEPDTGTSFEGVFKVDDGQIYADLLEEYDRLKMVTNALDSYPHGKPATEFYLSSRFGRRRDPIKKTWARHRAVDLAGWPGTPITATAPGKVVHSGWFGVYGNMVEIDHGNGFRTRYGHMRKLNVKKNEEVSLGQQLGEMGKTGRATDTHVHYEVRFDGKLLDPMRFMKAADNVLKIQGRYEQQGEETSE